MAKTQCTRENLLNADKERDFQRVAQSHDKWLRQEQGKGSHLLEVYAVDNGERRIPWASHRGEVSIGVRRDFVRRLIGIGLLVLPFLCAITCLIAFVL